MKQNMLTALAACGLATTLPADAAPLAKSREAAAGTIEGVADARIHGRQARCLGALLIPNSPAADAEIRQTFGNDRSGVRMLDESRLQRARFDRGAKASGSIRARCNPYSNRYSFAGIAPGDYYVTALVAAPGDRTGFERTIPPSLGAVLMRRVTVQPGRQLRVTLKD